MLKSVFASLEQQKNMDVQGKLLQQQIYYLLRENTYIRTKIIMV